MAVVSARSQESLLFPMKSQPLMPNMIFAKQTLLKPGRKSLRLSPPTLVCVAWEGKAVRLCISYWKRELAFFSEFLLLCLGGACTVLFPVPELSAGPVSPVSGGEPGLDLQGQLVQGVLIDDQGLVQQVVSDLGWATQVDRRHVTATEISQLSFPSQHILDPPLCCFLEKPSSCLECYWHKEAPAALWELIRINSS